MQTSEVISVNIWQILISLANLLILFLLLKKFLYKPVRKMLAQRQAEIDADYGAADEAKQAALQEKEVWEQKMQSADAQANAVLQAATDRAAKRESKLVAEAQEKADGIVRQAEYEAKLERKKATAGIKQEIVEVSTKLTEKMLEREIRLEDHQQLIDSFIEEIGEEHDGDR